MIFKGRVHKVGANIDTDAIIPARYLVTTDPKELGKYCMAGLDPEWVKKVKKGDILVADKNFGCGSSREHAPLAILGAGIRVVVAHSFARIFYRNGFNKGLILIEAGEDAKKIKDGDELLVDTDKGLIKDLTQNIEVSVPPLPEFMREILDAGGLVEYVREKIK